MQTVPLSSWVDTSAVCGRNLEFIWVRHQWVRAETAWHAGYFGLLHSITILTRSSSSPQAPFTFCRVAVSFFCETSTWANTKPKCIRLIIISSKARVNDTDSMLRLGHSLAEFWQQIIVRSHEVVNRFSNLKVMTGSNYQQFNSEFIYLSRPASEIMMHSERRG